jgi:hypothetical protein
MKILKIIPVLFFLFFFQMNGISYTRIYLISEVEISKDNLLVSDICKMEGDNLEVISNLVISPELYRDNIVDNKELYEFLSQSIVEKLFIFGSGVKITKSLIKEKTDPVKIILVEKGDLIEISFKKNGITIEMKGKALNNGAEKEEIDFKLSTGKVIKGIITSEKKADIIL